MTTTADAAATPADITLGGKAWKMSPLTRADRGEFTRWLQQQVMAAARQGLTADMSADDRRELMDAAVRQASRIDMTTREGLEKIATQSGIARLLWLGIRHHHPDITPDKVEDMLDAAAIEASMEVWDMLNLPAGARGKAVGAAGPLPNLRPSPQTRE